MYACQVHGSTVERDRILSRPDVVDGSRDIYLTTYDTFQVHRVCVIVFPGFPSYVAHVAGAVCLDLVSECSLNVRQSEEAFFTETFLFHTLTIDEGLCTLAYDSRAQRLLLVLVKHMMKHTGARSMSWAH